MRSSHRVTRLISVYVAAVCMGATAEPTRGQTVQGVRIDAEGVLRARQAAAAPLKLDRRRDPERTSVSLPKLFHELRQLTEAGRELPERLLYLDGLVQIERIDVLPDRNDLILSGPAEAWDTSDPARPRGRRTGRPVVQLDDLVVALRTFGPASRSRVFGCTLRQDEDAVERVAALQRRILAERVMDQRVIARALQEAFGPLRANYFGVPTDSRYALTCIESDDLMKRLCLGLDRMPVPGVASYFGRSGRGHLFNRFWFVADYEPLLVSPDGSAIQIPKRGLALRTSDSQDDHGTKNDGASHFASDFTRHMPQLEAAVPAIADLRNLTDLAVVATLITEDELANRAGWDMSWILDADNYRVAEVTTPKRAETLVNVRRGRGLGVTVAGGVRVDTMGIVRSRQRSAGSGDAPAPLETNWSRRLRRPAHE